MWRLLILLVLLGCASTAKDCELECVQCAAVKLNCGGKSAEIMQPGKPQ